MDPEAFLDMANQVLIIIIKIIPFIKIISNIKTITITIMEININAAIYFYVGDNFDYLQLSHEAESEPALITIIFIITTIVTITVIIITIKVTKLKMYPYFDLAHAALCCLAVRDDLANGSTIIVTTMINIITIFATIIWPHNHPPYCHPHYDHTHQARYPSPESTLWPSGVQPCSSSLQVA